MTLIGKSKCDFWHITAQMKKPKAAKGCWVEIQNNSAYTYWKASVQGRRALRRSVSWVRGLLRKLLILCTGRHQHSRGSEEIRVPHGDGRGRNGCALCEWCLALSKCLQSDCHWISDGSRGGKNIDKHATLLQETKFLSFQELVQFQLEWRSFTMGVALAKLANETEELYNGCGPG